MNPIETPAGELHVWHVLVSEAQRDCAILHASLNETERARAARFHFERDRIRYIVTHGWLRRLLSAYTGCPAQSVPFEVGPHGKPASSLPESPHFNLSHADDLVTFAVASHPVGVDVERVRPDFASIDVARRFFSADEVAQLESAPPASRVDLFFQCWTRKEAWIKATGEGLFTPLNSFSVSLDAAPSLLHSASADTSTWSFSNLTTPAGYMGCVALQGSIRRVIEAPVLSSQSFEGRGTIAPLAFPSSPTR